MPVHGSVQPASSQTCCSCSIFHRRLNDSTAAALQFRYEPLRFDLFLIMRLLDIKKKQRRKCTRRKLSYIHVHTSKKTHRHTNPSPVIVISASDQKFTVLSVVELSGWVRGGGISPLTCVCLCSRVIQFRTPPPPNLPIHPSVPPFIHPAIPSPCHRAPSGNHTKIQLRGLLLDFCPFSIRKIVTDCLYRQIHNHVSSGIWPFSLDVSKKKKKTA